MSVPASEPEPQSPLNQISTRWAVLKDPVQFLLRYGPAIRQYLQALLKNSHDADEVSQDILTHVVQGGFSQASPDRGRFRDYLKIAVRNAAWNHFRRKQAIHPGDAALERVRDPVDTTEAVEQAWLADWQRCILNKAWRALDSHERESPGNLFFTVLQVSVEHAEADSAFLAEQASRKAGRPIKPEAFRKQLSRARRMFARLLVEEVAQTLEAPTPQQIEEELIDVGLMPYVRDFLPADWRTRGTLAEGD